MKVAVLLWGVIPLFEDEMILSEWSYCYFWAHNCCLSHCIFVYFDFSDWCDIITGLHSISLSSCTLVLFIFILRAAWALCPVVSVNELQFIIRPIKTSQHKLSLFLSGPAGGGSEGVRGTEPPPGRATGGAGEAGEAGWTKTRSRGSAQTHSATMQPGKPTGMR